MEFLDSNQNLVDALPRDIREKVNGFPNSFLRQVAVVWNLRNNPLPEGYQPDEIDVFFNGNPSGCLFVYKGVIQGLDSEFFEDSTNATVVVEINHEPRYVQIHGEMIVDALGGCHLPDLLISQESPLNRLTHSRAIELST